MGKLDYLSKYSDPQPHKEKKKKAKKRHRKDDVLLNDEDDLLFVPVKEEDDNDDDEDRPVVVNSTTVADDDIPHENHRPKQEFEPVLDLNATRKRRYDSDNDEQQPSTTIRPTDRSRRKRYDSDSDVKNIKSHTRKRYDSDDDDDKTTERKRHDSDDGEESSRGKQSYVDDDRVHRRKRRYDSDDDAPPSRVKRLDSDDDKVVPRKRYDSDDDVPSNRDKRFDSDDHKGITRKKRYDSDDDDESSRRKNNDLTSKKRYDSDDDESSGRVKNNPTSKKRYDSVALMTSGHAAGLQKAGDFRDKEVKIQEKRRREAQAMVDKHGMGETVYRNEFGQKVDSAPTAKVSHLNPREEAELRKGRVQKEQEANLQDQFRELQKSTFARHADDEALEGLKKDVIRKGDPMAAYAAKKKVSDQKASGKPVRPVYKGPAPKPNRFGIRPGYRWDGVDRGNGFEDKALASKFSTEHKKEQAYRWSTSDM